jgi:hypothetical protein
LNAGYAGVGDHREGLSKDGEVEIPFQPRRAMDILPGSRVKYFHPNGRVLAGTVMQVGCLNGSPDMWVWCTREFSSK